MNNMYATIFISLMLVLVYLTINSYFFEQDQDFLKWEFKTLLLYGGPKSVA